MDPSDLDDLHNGASGDDEPTPADGLPGWGDGWWRSVVEHSSEIVTVVDPDGTLRYANPAWGRALGYDPEEAVGAMNVLDHVHPEDLSHVLEETEKALSEGASPPTRPSTASAARTARGGGWRAWAPTCSTTRRSGAWWSPLGTPPSARRPRRRCGGRRLIFSPSSRAKPLPPEAVAEFLAD